MSNNYCTISVTSNIKLVIIKAKGLKKVKVMSIWFYNKFCNKTLYPGNKSGT
jgi:hypothetical protein